MFRHHPLDARKVGVAVQVLGDHRVFGYDDIVPQGMNQLPQLFVHLLRVGEHEVRRHRARDQILCFLEAPSLGWKRNESQVLAVPGNGLDLLPGGAVGEGEKGDIVSLRKVLHAVIDDYRAAYHPAVGELLHYEEDAHGLSSTALPSSTRARYTGIITD